jgi:hypothetical protein
MLCFSYLAGCDLYHRIALLNTRLRYSILSNALLSQTKVLTMKYQPDTFQLKYALELADVIHLVATQYTIDAVNYMAQMIDLKNDHSERKTLIDLTVKDLGPNKTGKLFSPHLDSSLIIRKFTAKESSSVALLNRLHPMQYCSQDNKYMNDFPEEVVELHDRTHDEYVRCQLNPNSKLWKSLHPTCQELSLRHSADMLKIIQFDSLSELESLRIEQHSLEQVGFLRNKLC